MNGLWWNYQAAKLVGAIKVFLACKISSRGVVLVTLEACKHNRRLMVKDNLGLAEYTSEVAEIEKSALVQILKGRIKVKPK